MKRPDSSGPTLCVCPSARGVAANKARRDTQINGGGTGPYQTHIDRPEDTVHDLDLAEINPLRWELARTRARVVQEYLRMAKPREADRQECAAELGISVNAFRRLLAAWKEGAGAKGLMVNGKHGPRHSTRLPPRSKTILKAAISLYGSGGTLKDVERAVAQQCANENVPSPSKATIHNHLMSARAEQQPTNLKPLIVVGELLITLPCVSRQQELVRPKLLVAVEIASRKILAYHVDTHTAAPRYLDLLTKLRECGHELPMVIDQAFLPDLAAATTSLGLGFESRASIRRRLSRTFGSRLNGLQLIYRAKAAAAPERVLAKSRGRTISFDMAVQALELAIRVHNQRCSDLTPDIQVAA